jgi:DNA-binding transcriptional LysR family regulator
MMDLRQLQVLRAIAMSGSMAGAARLLHYGQPTISHHLAALESHLDAELVERRPSGAVLSDLGVIVLEHAEVVLARVGSIESDVAAHREHGLLTLRIGAFATAATKLLPEALRQATAGSHVRIELTEAEPLDVLMQVRARSLHCALIYDVAGAPPSHSGDLQFETLFDDPFRVLLPSKHVLARKRTPVDLSQLADEGWIVSTGSYDPSDATLFATCQSLGFRPRVALRTDNYSVVHAFVAAGEAVALVPDLALEAGHAVTAVPVAQEVGARSIQFVTPAGPQPPVVERLRRELHSRYGARADK